jgi:hypothetical protein
MGARQKLMLTSRVTLDEARRIASNIAKLPTFLAANPYPD